VVTIGIADPVSASSATVREVTVEVLGEISDEMFEEVDVAS
jgi:hypothetical protein